jgi:hypothetical protein
MLVVYLIIILAQQSHSVMQIEEYPSLEACRKALPHIRVPGNAVDTPFCIENPSLTTMPYYNGKTRNQDPVPIIR